MTKLGVVLEHRLALIQMRVFISHGVNCLLAAFDRMAGVLGLHLDFFSEGCSMQMNGIFLNNGVFLNKGVREMLEREDFCAKNMVFPKAYIDLVTGVQNDANITGAQRMYSDTVSKVVS